MAEIAPLENSRLVFLFERPVKKRELSPEFDGSDYISTAASLSSQPSPREYTVSEASSRIRLLDVSSSDNDSEMRGSPSSPLSARDLTRENEENLSLIGRIGQASLRRSVAAINFVNQEEGSGSDGEQLQNAFVRSVRNPYNLAMPWVGRGLCALTLLHPVSACGTSVVVALNSAGIALQISGYLPVYNGLWEGTKNVACRVGNYTKNLFCGQVPPAELEITTVSI